MAMAAGAVAQVQPGGESPSLERYATTHSVTMVFIALLYAARLYLHNAYGDFGEDKQCHILASALCSTLWACITALVAIGATALALRKWPWNRSESLSPSFTFGQVALVLLIASAFVYYFTEYHAVPSSASDGLCYKDVLSACTALWVGNAGERYLLVVPPVGYLMVWVIPCLLAFFGGAGGYPEPRFDVGVDQAGLDAGRGRHA